MNYKRKGNYYRRTNYGERVYKLTGICNLGQVNSGSIKAQAIFDDAVLYPNPYIVISQTGYTKHYYAGTERIATVIGGGGFGDMDAPRDKPTQREQEIVYAFAKQYQQSDPFWQGMVMSYPVPTEDVAREQRGELEYLCPPTILDYVDVQFQWDILLNPISVYAQLNSKTEDIFFSHSYHLGSANWITDTNGSPIQYIHYAPYGELIENQHIGSWYDERYKFTGKERDEETGYDYFGARYWWLAGTWLSVDPLADKYPNISPYAYCAWNPIKYTDPDGRDVYMFDEDGTFVTKQVKEGTHYGMVFMDDKSNYSFEFADPINDPQAIDDGNINKVLFVTDDQISQILKESGVTEDKNRQNRYSYVYRESNASNIQGNGYMDYVVTGQYKGANISNYDNCLFLTNTNGRKVAHNTYNFGNFLWGAGTAALDIPYPAVKIGSNLNNFFNDPYSRWHFDAKDDQLSIKLGFQWQKRQK